MTGDTAAAVARLRELVLAGDLDGVRAHADGLTGPDRAAARRWVGQVHDLDELPWPTDPDVRRVLGDPRDPGTRDRERRMRLARLVSRARLCAPAATAKAVAATSLTVTDEHVDEVMPSFVEHDREWAEAFAAAADGLRSSARGAALVFRLHLAVVLAHGLPAPSGALFHQAWSQSLGFAIRYGDRAGADLLREDPLLPEVVHHQLASGHCGQVPTLGEALAPLVAEGLLDRGRVVGDVLAQLTAGQRASSQKALAAILTALDVSVDEVDGGLDLLLSILSSCHDSAVGPVLALAVASVRTGEEAVELARVLAPRSGKGVRRTLLGALSPGGLGTRIDHAALREAVAVLADGDDDVASAAAYDRARVALGGTAADTPDEPTALGLWDLSPRPPGERRRAHWTGRTPWRDRCWAWLRTGGHSPDPDLVDDLLDTIAGGGTTDELRATVHELASEGALSPVQAAALLEPLFLGGALRAAWPVALEVVALCAGPPRAVAGLDRLLGLLATYAVEVPRPVELPAAVPRLAGGRSRTALEAQRLLSLTGATTPATDQPARLGLWREASEPVPWALAYPPTRDLASIARRALDGVHHQVTGVRAGVLTSLLLDELAALAREHGVEEVRGRVAAAEDPYGPSPMAQALQVWARGLLTTESYWAMVRSTRAVADHLEQWREELGMEEGTAKAHAWTLADGVRQTPPVMPDWWTESSYGPPQRLQLLHTCEVLLAVERGGHVVSTPDVVDGSLGLDNVWERLGAAPLVGPLDLRLALGRLRPDLGAPRPAGAGAVVDGRFAAPDGTPDEQAYDVVERWVAGGGLRLVPAHGPHPGTWVYRGECAVPWASLAALAGTAIDDGTSWYAWGDSHVLPGRIDLALRHGFRSYGSDGGLADVGGALGVPGWRTLFDALGTATSRQHHGFDFTSLVRLQDQGRLDPAVAAAAAQQRWDEGLPDDTGALGWERAMLRGALRGLWPVAVAVAQAGLARDERPADLDDLLAVMRRRAHEVPPDLVPAFLEQR